MMVLLWRSEVASFVKSIVSEYTNTPFWIVERIRDVDGDSHLPTIDHIYTVAILLLCHTPNKQTVLVNVS